MIALLLPAIQAAREAARRSQCTNHLKQIGIAVHNFHDTLQGIPPTGVGHAPSGDPESSANARPRVGFWTLIMPFIEQPGLYQMIKEKTVDGSNNYFARGLGNARFWNTLTEEEQRACQSISYYRCPSRRGNATTLIGQNGPNTQDTANYGTQGDYAIAVGRQSTHWSGWMQDGNWTAPYEEAVGNVHTPEKSTAPFRTALWPYNVPRSWAPRDTFARIADGLSNQILVGEKFIARDNIGVCKDPGAAGSADRPMVADCSILGHFNWSGVAGSRSFNAQICNNLNQAANIEIHDEARVQWGGCHEAVVHFLLADGSVKAIPVTIPTGALGTGATPGTSILARLGNVDDGNPFIIPGI